MKYFPQLVYKPVSQTPKELLDSIEYKNKYKYFHTGNLDPMAEGLMLFIPTYLRFLEKFFKKYSKTYQFSIIQGFSTDTSDLLGMITDIYPKNELSIKDVIEYIKSISEQNPHVVSYRNLNTPNKVKSFILGKPLNEMQPKKVKVNNVRFINKTKKSKDDLYSYIKLNFSRLKKDFRQSEILNTYVQNYKNMPKVFTVYTFEISVSSGFYIRSLVRDISSKFEIPCTTYKIIRTRIGFLHI